MQEAVTFENDIKELPMSGDAVEISAKLHNNTAADVYGDEKNHLRKYSISSSSLNGHLINHGKPHWLFKKEHNTIMKRAKPIHEKVHLYSGISNNLHDKIMNNQNKTFLSPAHISMTHAPQIAKSFSDIIYGTENEYSKSMIHLETKPSDKVLHISKFAAAPSEYETIIPSGTVLKHHATTFHKDGNSRYVIHHMTIHSQE
jgi:hypothetical protein